VFVLRLTSVALIDSTDQAQPPKLDTSGTETELIIRANDGAQGVIEFAQDSRTVSVTEQGQNISLTVVRGMGTFGRVTAYFYSQPVTESTVLGQDYNVVDAELVFEEGESRKSIVLTILDDSDPEPLETFHIVLAQPGNGATLGNETTASVTILANDNAGGIISFDTADFIQMREATPNDPSGTKAEILIKRGPGAFGPLSVGYTVTINSGQFTGDINTEVGTIDFADRQTTAVLVLEVVNDDTPEVEETFTLTLQEPPGDAILGAITSRTLVVAASDAPYGLMEIYTAGSRLSSYFVEEAFRSLEFDIVRSQGTLGEISVDVMTVPGTATATTDMTRLVLAPISSAPGASVVDWHHVATNTTRAGSTSFLVVLTSLPSNTQLASLVPADSGLGAGQSVLFKWQGQLSHMRTFTTDGASAATSFISGSSSYLVVANSGREGARQVTSFLYSLSPQGELQVVEGYGTSGASDVTTFFHGTRRFLFVANSLDDSSRSDISSHLYSWDESQGRFGSTPAQLVPTLYARGVASFIVDGKTFVAVANYFDRSSGSYHVSSVIYRMASDLTLVQHQQLATQGAVSVVYTEAGNMQLLVVANNRQDVIVTPQDSFVYRWDALAQAFVLHQSLQTRRALKVTATRTSGGSALLIFANSVGDSEIFVWDVERSQYKSAWTGGSFQALRPVSFRQPDGALDAVAAAHLDRLAAPQLYQLAHVGAGSDFVPRRVTMTFEPGQAVLRTSVVTLTDDTPEDTESFSVSVVSPQGGAEIGPQSSVAVEMLSNDDAHGVIEFNEDSLDLTVEESVDKDTTVQLNVVRRLGYFGRVVVAWQATGDHGGVGDITPLTGQVTFPNGQSVATITLTVRDDREPEFDEVTYIRLTSIVDDGTTLDAKGARLGANTVSAVTVLANDSPYGVVAWEHTALTVSEPEGTDKSVAVAITRRQGLERAITVTYVTSVAATLPESSQAQPGEDFVSTQDNVVLAEGISTVRVPIVIKQDSHPEADETFLVNLTSVTFQNQEAGSGAAPSIALNGGVMEITITENDNARGFVELDVNTNNEGRLDVYEELGRNVTVELPIRRKVGFFGSLIVTWQADSVEADIRDYSPASGTVEFADQQRESKIIISILDDAIPENMETFDVKLIDVTGDAGLGQTTTVRIAILKNDSPTGLFRFATSQVETREARTTSDPTGQATVVVQRVQGNQGLVNVRWRLNAEAESDFMPPLEGTVQFSQGEVEKAIVLQTRPDDILEGREEFIVSLVSADNNADISSTGGDSTVVILPDSGASGTISVLPDFRSVLVGEPGQSSPSYPGEVEIKLTRGLGIFGEVVITWSLTPRDLSAFLQVEGSLRFRDLQQTASIILQTRDDSVPELRQTFILRLNSASGGAVLSPQPGAVSASVTYTASDYPHGLVQFVLPPAVDVSEDQGNVRVTVSRGKGLNGQLEVSYSTEPGQATENQDYLPSAGVLSFPAGVDTQTITVAILQDNLAEGPEDLFVNLTSIVLVDDTNDYTEVGGLSRDMAPALGPLSSKRIVITKNDNAEGILQFSQDIYSVKEELGLVTLTVNRMVGNYGSVSVRYRTEMLTATEDVDYVGADGVLFLTDGTSEAEFNITLRDDSSMEQLESFRVVLFNVTGGAQLGSPEVATVNILKSDYPNGRFAFQGPLQVSLPNQETPQRTVLTIERTGGVLGQQEVFWRIMGPNNPNLQLEDTTDISYLSDQGAEITTGSFSWADSESGTRQLTLDIKAYNSWEVEKTFVVELYRVVPTPQSIGEGEVDQSMAKVAIKIERFGDPNGVVEFTEAATTERQILEPEGTSLATLVFELTRKTGTGVVGTIEIFWEVRPASPSEKADVQQTEGSIVMTEGQRDAQIVVNILPDDIPELTEQFSVVLVRVEGGAILNPTLRESKFSIRYNDQPHGMFGLQAERQAVEVNADMSRHVKVSISRLAGTFGRVLASYTISYDLSATGIALDPSSGSMTFEEGENETVALVSIRGNAFLPLGSTFTVRLISVRYLGSGASGEPEIRDGMSNVQVAVPSLAANTELSFSSSIAFVDEDTNTLTVILKRSGTYGSVGAQWISGYSPTDKPQGVENGDIDPSSGVVQMAHGQEEANLTVQVTAQVNRSEAFLLRLPRSPQTVVSGGARLAQTNQIVQADPGGVIQFSTHSVTAEASELDGKLTLTIWRLYGSESGLAVYYETVAATANSALDFQHVRSGMKEMGDRQTLAHFDIQGKVLNWFTFYMHGTQKVVVESPRLSRIDSRTLSTVTIAESNDPYGILSLMTTQEEVAEAFAPVVLTVIRSGGDFGTISVRVRTVGGREQWTSEIVPDTTNTGRPPDTIAQALGRRGNQGIATGGEDYNILDTTVEMQAGETEKRVQVTILEDTFPEDAESILVYLTQPVGGARIATGINDGGKKGFTEVRIEPSDLGEGSIQFEDSSRNVQVDEDVSPPVATLKLARFNHFIGNVTVNWRAKKTLSSTDQEDADLASQLSVTAGSVICPAQQTQCDLLVQLIPDNIPEESYAFVVVLTSTEPTMQLPPEGNSAEVVILPSDDVRGLIQFTQESRTVIVGESTSQVQLTVRRDKGQQYDVEVAYETEQMTTSVNVAGSTVYPALETQDFRRQTGTLVFSSNVQAGTATVRLVEDDNVAIWRIISGLEEDTSFDDTDIINIATQLREQAESSLTTKSLNLVEEFLTKVNEEGEKRSLPTNVVTPIKDLYCTLLDSTIDDARRGRNSLGTTLEKFSYTLLKDKPCNSGSSGSSSTNDLNWAECDAVRIGSGRWPRNQLTGNQFNLQQQNSIKVPDPLPANTAGGQNSECIDFSLLEYKQQTWFHTGGADDGLMNSAIIGFGLRDRQSGSIQNPVTFTIHTKDRRIAVKGAQCQYYDDAREKWVSPSGVCRVINNLGGEDFVTCECLHMTHYGVSATTRGDDIVGYVVWFYVICFICMTCILLAVIVHHLFFSRPTFSAGLHMHFLMAVFFTHMCFVIDTFLSEDTILPTNSSDDNSDCIAMSLFLHYFILAQFMWIATQAVNLWKIFVLNDEHTDRHFIVFFIIGWGVPVVLVAIFYAVTFNIYKYHTGLDVQFIYGDVNNNREVCFITNGYVALGGILAPALVCLFVLGLMCMKAYQVASQWQMYDDVYRGRSNEQGKNIVIAFIKFLMEEYK
ncbi:G-protein coupled receptor 98-like, partial [Elysia marginata]